MGKTWTHIASGRSGRITLLGYFSDVPRRLSAGRTIIQVMTYPYHAQRCRIVRRRGLRRSRAPQAADHNEHCHRHWW